MRLSKLVENLPNARLLIKGEEKEVFCLVTDSREKMTDGLFFCLLGENVDSHNLVGEAIKNGAVAIVTNRELSYEIPQIIVEDEREALSLLSAEFYGNPSERLKIIGITGTNGKTTTSYMLASILEKNSKKTGVIGTLGIRYGVKEIPNDLTTPDPIFLQKILSEMLVHGIEYVVMEVSAHALYYKKTLGVKFFACIFTNLTQDHLDFFQTMQRYEQTKTSLFYNDICPIAIVNGDDAVGRKIGEMREKETVGKTVYYGMETPSDAFAIVTEETLYGAECVLNINDKLCRCSLSLTGKHNVYNALAAAACAAELGVPLTNIAAGISDLKTVKGRLQRIENNKKFNIYVDFAHTPDGLGKSLDSLRTHCKGRLICLFGCGGNRDKTKRPLMGETVAKKADFAVLTSDNPRYEDPLDIISNIEKGYRRFSLKYVVVPNREKALEYALDCLKKDDVLLVAGKGGEEYQEIMGIKYSFNDQDIIEKLLEKKGKSSFV